MRKPDKGERHATVDQADRLVPSHVETTSCPVDEGADHKASSQARKPIMKISLKAPRTATACWTIRRMKTVDPVAKKIVANRRRLLAGRRLIERRAARRSLGTGFLAWPGSGAKERQKRRAQPRLNRSVR